MKPLFTIAGIVLLIGIIFFGGAILMNGGFSFEKSYITTTVTVEEAFSSISFDVNTTDITILPATDEKCTLTLHENKKHPHTTSVENETLTVKGYEKKWYHYIQLFDFGTPKITLYLPMSEYLDLSIICSTGDVDVAKDLAFDTIDIKLSTGDAKIGACAKNLISIHGSTGRTTLENVNAGSIDLSRSTGNTVLNEVLCSRDIRIKSSTGNTTISQTTADSLRVTTTTGRVTMNGITCAGDIAITTGTGKSTLTSVHCKDLISEADTGDLTMTSVIATGEFSIERDTGDVRFNGCDAAQLRVVTDTGSVSGSLLTDKIFIVSTDTGRISIPESTSGGKCKITTDTGNIAIAIAN